MFQHIIDNDIEHYVIYSHGDHYCSKNHMHLDPTLHKAIHMW